MTITQFLFNRFYRHQPSRDVAYPHWEDIHSVLILFDSDYTERNTALRSIVQSLHNDNKQVVSWGYVKKKVVESPNLPESRILGLKDFNLFLRPQSDVQTFLQRHDFDLLINLSAVPNLRLDYLTLLAQAQFKVGIQNAPYYDMVVACNNQDIEYAYSQVTHFLTTIKSLD